MKNFDKILQKTLDDYRLSRGERRVVGNILKEIGADSQQLAYLRHRAFEMARQEIVSPDAAAVLKWLEDVIKLLQPTQPVETRPAEALFMPGDDGPAKIAGLFRRSQRSVDVCVFTITDNRVAEAICETHQRGVPVRIITDDDKENDAGSDISDLRRKGVPVRTDADEFHMHHKFAIFDSEALLTGSYNWTRGAAERNHESFLITYEKRLVERYIREFEQLWQKFS